MANADQADVDSDGIGNACDPDADGDGLVNALEVAMGSDPLNAASTPEFVGYKNTCTDGIDKDSDSNGDAADNSCTDADGDTAPDSIDNCPQVQSENLLDTDHDGKGNACDPDDPPGDVDRSGSTSIADAVGVMRWSAGLEVQQPCEPIGYGAQGNGDVNCDGQTNVVDALEIVETAAQIQTSLPAGCLPIGQ